jgi:hypothetical protein
MENYFITGSIYLATLLSSFLSRDAKTLFIGLLSITSLLTLLELPDIPDYKAHYELAENGGKEVFDSIYNFEIGYNALVFFASIFLPFEIFYIITLASVILSYNIFFKNNAVKLSWLYLLIFLSIALYFVSFTIRTSIASLLIVISLLLLKDSRWLTSLIAIGIGALFHTATLPCLIFVAVSVLRKFINSFWILFFLLISLVIFWNITFFYILELIALLPFFESKILAYETQSGAQISIFALLWLVVFLYYFMNPKQLNHFEQNILLGLFFIFMVFIQNEFFLGRLMWLTSFIFVYFFTNILLRFYLNKDVLFLIALLFPLLILIRF